MTEKNDNKPLGVLRIDQTRFVILPQWDLLNLLMAGVTDLPVMFSTRVGLDQWCNEKQITQTSLTDIPEQEAIRCFAEHYDGMQNIVYDFVWTPASSIKFRKAIHAKLEDVNETETMQRNVHVDHVLNRGSVSDFKAVQIDPWLMLFEVPDRANTRYGAKVERGQKLPTNLQRVDLKPLMLFKLLGVDFPGNRAEADELLAQCEIKLGDAKNWFERMKADLYDLFP